MTTKKQNNETVASTVVLAVVLMLVGFAFGFIIIPNVIAQDMKQTAATNFNTGYDVGYESRYIEAGYKMGVLDISEEEMDSYYEAKRNYLSDRSFENCAKLANIVAEISQKINK